MLRRYKNKKNKQTLNILLYFTGFVLKLFPVSKYKQTHEIRPGLLKYGDWKA